MQEWRQEKNNSKQLQEGESNTAGGPELQTVAGGLQQRARLQEERRVKGKPS